MSRFPYYLHLQQQHLCLQMQLATWWSVLAQGLELSQGLELLQGLCLSFRQQRASSQLG